MNLTGNLPHWAVEAAIQESLLSPCQSKRGAVVYSETSILGRGHNHKLPPYTCDRSDICKSTCWHYAIHAEQAAIVRAYGPVAGFDLLHVKTIDGQLVPSGPPSCYQCSKLILYAELGGVWLFHLHGWHRYTAQEFHSLSLPAGA